MSNWSSDFAVTNNIQLHYHRTGGDKPPVVLCHGITDSGLCWTPVAQVLEKDHDVIMVDARGHGQSTAPETGYGREDHAADLAGLIEALDLEKPALLGHSMGAAVAAVVAAEYPHLVSRIALEDPPWSMQPAAPEDRQSRMKNWQGDIREHQSKTDEELIAFVRQRSPDWSENELDPWVNAKKSVSLNALRFVTADHLWKEGIPKITCPTLVLCADSDLGAIVTSETADYVTETNDNIQVTYIAGAGHNIRREQFQAYMDAVTRFLAETATG